MVDLENFNKIKQQYIIPIYSGKNVFNETFIKYHPVFKIKDDWFALTHSSINPISIIKKNGLTGDYYTGLGQKREIKMYLTRCISPKHIAKNISGYLYLKPYRQLLGLTDKECLEICKNTLNIT